MNDLSLQSYTPPGKYLITASFEGLLSLLNCGFFICRVRGAPNGETYIAVNERELREMWQMTDNAAWDAYYLTTATGHINAMEHLAGVVVPFGNHIVESRVGWDFQIGLKSDHISLPAGAQELIALVQQQVHCQRH